MTILLCDPRVSAVPVIDCGEPLVRLPESFGPARALVRLGLARRLAAANLRLPTGIALRVVEGHRRAEEQRAIIARYRAEVLDAHPSIDSAEADRLTSRFVAPLEVAPHVAGAAVDLTLVDRSGRELDMGTRIDATPEQSDGACFFASERIEEEARTNRGLLADALSGAGLVNYPTEWWHWSYGDRYWALATGAGSGVYGPVAAGDLRAVRAA
ncbi:MAG: M15 family metallopeptidase [Actinobacteria bacterium]|nr:M15 family metallopeptidase [Actinomycetota bacterium]